MFQGHRVVICVPSGRYRYLRILLPYLLAERHSNIVDEVQLWVNTDVQSDLDYFARMEATHSKVKRAMPMGSLNKILYDAKRDHWQFNDSVYRFYQNCVVPGVLYCKVDDDICYVHDKFFENMLKAVIDRAPTNYACVGNVFNVPHTTKLHQEHGVLDTALGTSTGDPRCPVACTNGEFAAYIHNHFLGLVERSEVENLFFSSHQLFGRQRIGVMAWTGESFKQFGGKIGPRDEVELTTRIPETLLKPLWMVGDAVVSHFAFSHQRAVLEDQTDTLNRYLSLSIKLNGDVAA